MYSLSLSYVDWKTYVWWAWKKLQFFCNSQLKDAIRNRSLIPKQIKSIVQCAILTINGIIVISISKIELYYLEGDVGNIMLDKTFEVNNLLHLVSCRSHMFYTIYWPKYSIKYKLPIRLWGLKDVISCNVLVTVSILIDYVFITK